MPVVYFLAVCGVLLYYQRTTPQNRTPLSLPAFRTSRSEHPGLASTHLVMHAIHCLATSPTGGPLVIVLLLLLGRSHAIDAVYYEGTSCQGNTVIGRCDNLAQGVCCVMDPDTDYVAESVELQNYQSGAMGNTNAFSDEITTSENGCSARRMEVGVIDTCFKDPGSREEYRGILYSLQRIDAKSAREVACTSTVYAVVTPAPGASAMTHVQKSKAKLKKKTKERQRRANNDLCNGLPHMMSNAGNHFIRGILSNTTLNYAPSPTIPK